jgi:hypothetical protein
MARILALLVALAALGFSIYLAVLLGLIKRRGFGAGRRVDLPAASLSLRVPSWWTADRRTDAGRAADANEGPGEIRLRTGNHRGLVSIRTVDVRGPLGTDVDDGDPAAALRRFVEASVHSMGLTLDAVEVEVERLEPTWHAWLASGGRSSADPETRTYYEIHLIAGGGGAAALVYTNGILFGPLDAFYVAEVVRTFRPLGGPSPS